MRVRWAELWYWCVWEIRNTYIILVGSVKGRDTLQDVGIDGRIILKCIFNKPDGRAWSEFVWLSGQTRGGVL
jgi:hypothetical protein